MSLIFNALKKAQQDGKNDELSVPISADNTHLAQPDWGFPAELIKEFSMLRQKAQQAHAEQGIQIIGITSSVPQEGCTTIAYFLSLILSQSLNGFFSDADKNSAQENFQKQRRNGVLLIDGNLDRSLLHRLFNTARSPGLTDFFSNVNSSNIFTRSITSSNLYLITAGSADSNRHDIWAIDRMKNLFARLKENFEYIIIDAPPVLEHPETLSLCKLADGVLLVVKANQTRLEVIDEAKLRLQDAGAKLLGVVLNERRFFIPQMIYKRI